jgi:Flp pilus assembly protein TadG
MNRAGRQKRKGERGQSLVELAVSFTVLMLLLSISVDLGRAFFAYVAIREAAEEGALHASLNPGDTAGIEARVRTSSTTPIDMSNEDNVEVDSTPIGAACAGNSVRVTVSYNFHLTMPFLAPILGTNEFPLIAESTSTILRPEC